MEPFYAHQRTHDATPWRVAPSRGFTLLEMIVVLGIIIVISAIVFSSQTSFNGTVILSDTTYDVALAIRDTENSGTGSIGQGTYYAQSGQGVHFDYGSPKQFLTFADTNPTTPGACHTASTITYTSGAPDAHPGDCVYTAGSDTLPVTYTIGNGIAVAGFCVDQVGTWYCTAGSGTNVPNIQTLDITSVRPNTTITFATGPGAQATYNSSSAITEACIKFTLPGDAAARYVYINSSGLIETQSTSCAGTNTTL